MREEKKKDVESGSPNEMLKNEKEVAGVQSGSAAAK